MSEKLSEEEGMNPLERGRRRYLNKDFAGALEAFTEAVEVSTDHLLLDALDNRAATYEKLGQFQAALRDAKEMIDMKPRLSKGYLRCGKILQLKGEPGVALKIYERGLQKVKIGTDNRRPILQNIYNKLREAQNPGTTRDPLQHLPLELAEMVIQNLTMRDRVVCLAVSKGWKRLLESSYKLWTIFDTTNVKKVVTQKSLKVHLKRSNCTLEQAIISTRAGVDIEKLKLITKNCKKLREMQFLGTGLVGDSLTASLPLAKNLNTLIVGRATEISLSTVQRLLERCQESLQNATFLNVKGNLSLHTMGRWTSMESLRSIHLQADKNSILDIEGLCKATPNVTSVVLNDWNISARFVDLSSWIKVNRLDLSNTQLMRWPLLPLSLTHLLVSNNTRLNIPIGEENPVSLPLLHTFACHSTFITADHLKVITHASIKAGNLKRLSVGGRDTDFHNIPVTDEFPASKTVEELSLAAMILGDERMAQIVNLYPNLKRLDASATKITGVSVKKFVNLGIKWLRLSECQDVGTDAVEWARGMGIEVEYLFPSRSLPGRVQRFTETTFARGF